MKLTQKKVRQLLHYNPNTGALVWRSRPGLDWWNTQHANKPAFTSTDGQGYRQGRILNRTYRAHRVIFLYMVGRFPRPAIDFIDRDCTNLRWHNLRETDHTGNARNMTMYKTNKSGFTGVRFNKRLGKHQARIFNSHIGTFATLGEALIARRRSERKYGFTIGHGT